MIIHAVMFAQRASDPCSPQPTHGLFISVHYLCSWIQVSNDQKITLSGPSGSFLGWACCCCGVCAVFRGARAALKLGEWEECRQLVQQGLQLEAGAQELLQIQQVR